MQPLKITLLGDYYDCQLYRGRLYLWTFNGELRIYNWDQLVDKVVQRNGDWLTYLYGYREGRYLYNSKTKKLFEDDEFKKIVIKRYLQSCQRQHVLTEKDVEDCLIGQQTAPSSSIPIDTEIYNSILYYSTDKGLFSTTAHRAISEKYKVSTKPKKIWDAKVLSITANDYPQMAVSAGSEGLYEFRPGLHNLVVSVLRAVEPGLYKVSNRFSLFSNYVYESIFSSSHSGNSYISMFKLDRNDNSYQRVYEKEIEEEAFSLETIKGNEVLSWGIRDRVYQAVGDKIRVLKFKKWSENSQGNRMNDMGLVDLKCPSRLIKGGAASFGNILEFDDSLLVIMSDDQRFVIPHEITRWRIYPRSINYLNQLHVIMDDRVEFFSFNHDSSVDQASKLNGIEYYVPTSSKARKMYSDVFDDYI